MLRIGLSGGIGAGKSALSTTFSECGGIIVDGDVIAREVVEPGTEGLAALVKAFGADILQPDGALDRPALAAKAFADEEQRQKLNGIVHPLVGKRRAEIIESVSPDSVVVEDIPLLVESGMAPMFPLVVIVHAEEEVRIRRLVDQRGMSEDDARARIAAQATEEQRRAVADIWMDNAGSQADLQRRARDVWHNRIVPFARNLTERDYVRSQARLMPADASWPDQAGRIVNRLKTTCGHRALRIDHIGSTVFAGDPDFAAKDVIDIQITVATLDLADELAEPLLAAGYPRLQHIMQDTARADARSTHPGFNHREDATLWHKRIHASADPGRPTHVHIRVDGWPNQQFALLFRDWLKANPDVRQEYLDVKRAAEAEADGDAVRYVTAKEPWFGDAYRRAWDWADATGWRP